MKRLLLLLVLYVGFSHFIFAQNTYSKAKVYVDKDGLLELSRMGIDVTEGLVNEGVFFL